MHTHAHREFYLLYFVIIAEGSSVGLLVIMRVSYMHTCVFGLSMCPSLFLSTFTRFCVFHIMLHSELISNIKLK